MDRTRLPIRVLTWCALVALVAAAKAQDRGKGYIEGATKHVLAVNTATAPAVGPVVIPRIPDVGKGVIEDPMKRVLAARSATTSPTGSFVNPKVQPGAVVWHPTFESACAASRKSGKPVLLFQMMGKLDEQFC
jgi:hypothetical protein